MEEVWMYERWMVLIKSLMQIHDLNRARWEEAKEEKWAQFGCSFFMEHFQQWLVYLSTLHPKKKVKQN